MLREEIAVVPVQLPGREGRINEHLHVDILPLAEQIASNIVERADKPFAIFGHSLGAILGFEVARWLHNNTTITPLHLFVAGQGAPQVASNKAPTYALPDDQFIKELERFNATPAQILQNKDVMAILMPILRADFRLAQTYVYTHQPPLRCPITAYGGREDRCASVADLEKWECQTSSDFSLEIFQGDHFFLKQSRDTLLRNIERRLHEHC